MRYELADYEWDAIKPMLPNKSRGAARVNDRLVLNGPAIWSTLARSAGCVADDLWLPRLPRRQG